MASVTNPGKAVLVLRKDASGNDVLRKEARAAGLDTDTALIKALGISVQTLWRATNGKPVGSPFMAAVVLIFGTRKFQTIFEVKMRDEVEAAA